LEIRLTWIGITHRLYDIVDDVGLRNGTANRVGVLMEDRCCSRSRTGSAGVRIVTCVRGIEMRREFEDDAKLSIYT